MAVAGLWADKSCTQASLLERPAGNNPKSLPPTCDIPSPALSATALSISTLVHHGVFKVEEKETSDVKEGRGSQVPWCPRLHSHIGLLRFGSLKGLRCSKPTLYINSKRTVPARTVPGNEALGNHGVRRTPLNLPGTPCRPSEFVFNEPSFKLLF